MHAWDEQDVIEAPEVDQQLQKTFVTRLVTRATDVWPSVSSRSVRRFRVCT